MLDQETKSLITAMKEMFKLIVLPNLIFVAFIALEALV
mgnify:CR=1 FL=1